MTKTLEKFRKPLQSCPKSKPKEQDMTICIAAICKAPEPQNQFDVVVGAADRMMTAGDVEFEPQQSKIVSLTKSVFALLAGDATMQTEIIQRVYSRVNGRVLAHPDDWWVVKEVAEIYAETYRQIRLKRAELEILSPLNLTCETFLEKQHLFSDEFTRRTTDQMQNFAAMSPPVNAIICGVDKAGAHIFIVKGDTVINQDGIGFAAIGSGDWHANSQFMFAKHTRHRPFSDTLLLTYVAKKRAEAAPGIGAATDMILVGPNLGHSVHPIGDHVLGKLQSTFDATNARVAEINQSSNTVVSEFIMEAIQSTAQPQSNNTSPPVVTLTSTTKEE